LPSSSSADAQVADLLLQIAQHLVLAALRLQEVRVIRDPLPELVRVLGHLEEVVLLLEPLDRVARHGALAIDQVLLGPEPLLGLGVPALVVRSVDVTRIIQRLECRLDHPGVAVFRGADEVIVGDLQPLPERLEWHAELVHVLLRTHSPLGGSIVHLLAVLIGTGQEICIPTILPVPAGDHIGRERRVGMADMRHIVHIVDRRGDIEGRGHGRLGR
jgi:hypothetical protein